MVPGNGIGPCKENVVLEKTPNYQYMALLVYQLMEARGGESLYFNVQDITCPKNWCTDDMSYNSSCTGASYMGHKKTGKNSPLRIVH
jgi:hypothetical protein